MIIFRPHRSSLLMAIKESKEFLSLKDLLNYIVEEHNKIYSFFKISVNDLNIQLYNQEDPRIKWHDVFIILFESYDRINDKLGYLKYFNNEIYNHPCGVLGFFSTNYEKFDK